MLRIAILSLLADRDYSGYDLSKAFDASITNVWAARQSQIYPELHRLEQKGLVAGVAVPQAGRPDKRMYHLTSSGRADLVAWVAEPAGPLQVRDPFQLRTINFGRLSRERARELVAEQRAMLRDRLDRLAAIRDMLEAAGHAPGEPFDEQIGWRLTVEAGLRTHQAYLEWCDWADAHLADAPAPPPRGEGSISAEAPRHVDR